MPDVQWSRLKYLLANGVKEGLVESPLDWPGVSCAKALVHGEPLEGYWFNRSKEWSAHNRSAVAMMVIGGIILVLLPTLAAAIVGP